MHVSQRSLLDCVLQSEGGDGSDSDDSDVDMTSAELRARQRNQASSTTPNPATTTTATTDDTATVALTPTLTLCLQVLKGIMRRREAQAAFNEPIDPVERDIPYYHLVVKRPMDLGTVKERLLSGYYNPDSEAKATEGEGDVPST